MADLTRYASPYNRLAPSAQSASKPPKVTIHDLTLEGDGEEMAGVVLSEPDRLEIARRLAAMGVDRMAILGNSPLPPDSDIRCAEKIVALDLPARLDAFVKTKEEIDIAKRVGLWGVDILVGVNDAMLPAGKSGVDILDRCKSLTGYAKQQGLNTCLMGMDATRTRPEFLREVVTALEPYVDEFTIGDSLGTISPYGLQYLIELVTSWTTKPVQVHLHNHSSMAVANALAAVLGGAATIQTTVNGLGEFTGLVPLEEFAVAASMHLGVPTGIDLRQLKELSDFVAGAIGIPVPLQKPVVGDAAFCVPETEEIQQVYWELEQEGRFEDALTYPPRLIGSRYRQSIGRRCNPYTVLYHLSLLGYTADEHVVAQIVAAVRARMKDRKGFALMDENEFRELVASGDFKLQPLAETRMSSFNGTL
jgi:isopropylmalate/homocitrate/citramalate synthase